MDSIQSYMGTRVTCPFCRQVECLHHIGWTRDGRTIELMVRYSAEREEVLPADMVVNTGVSTRVYRNEE